MAAKLGYQKVQQLVEKMVEPLVDLKVGDLVA